MLSDRDVCLDVVKDLKYISFMETVFAAEASPDLKPLFLNQLRDHEDLHTQFLRLMEQRGWYPRVPGDWAFNEPYALQGAGAWQAPQAGLSWQASQPGGWQAAQPAGGSWQGGGALQGLQPNPRESR